MHKKSNHEVGCSSRRLRNLRPQFALCDAIMAMWTKMSEQCFEHLVESMPQRTEAVLESEVHLLRQEARVPRGNPRSHRKKHANSTQETARIPNLRHQNNNSESKGDAVLLRYKNNSWRANKHIKKKPGVTWVGPPDTSNFRWHWMQTRWTSGGNGHFLILMWSLVSALWPYSLFLPSLVFCSKCTHTILLCMDVCVCVCVCCVAFVKRPALQPAL